ncbi:hypothetical protein Misp06_03804 [Microbulbifer sp. NBRC 101763]
MAEEIFPVFVRSASLVSDNAHLIIYDGQYLTLFRSLIWESMLNFGD